MTEKLSTITDEAAIAKLGDFTNVKEMKDWAAIIIDSGLLPNAITEPEQVITIVQHGKELGISPHIALNNINVISGRPTLSSSMLGSLVKKRGIEWVWDEDFVVIKGEDGKTEKTSDGNANRRTTIRLFWKSGVTNRVMETTFSVTWAQFMLQGLTGKSNWVKLPKEIKNI